MLLRWSVAAILAAAVGLFVEEGLAGPAQHASARLTAPALPTPYLPDEKRQAPDSTASICAVAGRTSRRRIRGA